MDNKNGVVGVVCRLACILVAICSRFLLLEHFQNVSNHFCRRISFLRPYAADLCGSVMKGWSKASSGLIRRRGSYDSIL